MHQGGEAAPQKPWSNKPGIRRSAAWLLGEQMNQFGRAPSADMGPGNAGATTVGRRAPSTVPSAAQKEKTPPEIPDCALRTKTATSLTTGLDATYGIRP